MLMRIQKRIYGIENELGVVMRSSAGDWSEIRTGYAKKMLEPNSACVWVDPRLWHCNGGCIYVDTGEHPEYATPECASITDAVLYAKAGEFIMRDIFSKPSAFNGERIILIKNNIGYGEPGESEKSFGCHENYLTHGFDVNDKTMVERFIPFLITRQIMDGAGWWQSDGTFLRSQRSTCIEKQVENATTSQRPLITKRDTLNDTGPRRLHLILGDANILDVACFLKLGTTSLVLSLIESGLAPEIEFEFPIQSMKRIASQPDITTPHPELRYKGKHLSAFDTQVIYHEAAQLAFASAIFASERIREELQLVLHLWEQALHALFANNITWMIGRIDYVTKQYLTERLIAQKQFSSPSDIQTFRKNFDILYHNITDREFQLRCNQRWPERRLITDKQIEKACYFPPRETRAAMRGLFVASIVDISNQVHSGIDWKFCQDGELPESNRRYSMDDPFISSSPKFIEFLISCLNLPHEKKVLRYAPADIA